MFWFWELSYFGWKNDLNPKWLLAAIFINVISWTIKWRKRLLFCKSSISSRVHRGVYDAPTSLFHELKLFLCFGLISVPGEVHTPLFFCPISLTCSVNLWDRWARDVSVYVQRSDTPHSAGVPLSSAADLHLIVWPRSKTQSFPAFIASGLARGVRHDNCTQAPV